MFVFKDLDQTTRAHMLCEANLQGGHVTDYYGKRLTEAGKSAWPELLRAAIRTGTPEWLADALAAIGLMKTMETSHRKGVPYERAVPSDARQLLAEGEFNRYYCRAVCIRALSEGRKVLVYRGRHSYDPRSVSEQWIGKHVEAQSFLDDLRASPGQEPRTGIPLVNSGLTVCLD